MESRGRRRCRRSPGPGPAQAATRKLPEQGEHEPPNQRRTPLTSDELKRLPEPVQDEAELVPHDPEVEVLLEDDVHNPSSVGCARAYGWDVGADYLGVFVFSRTALGGSMPKYF